MKFKVKYKIKTAKVLNSLYWTNEFVIFVCVYDLSKIVAFENPHTYLLLTESCSNHIFNYVIWSFMCIYIVFVYS